MFNLFINNVDNVLHDKNVPVDLYNFKLNHLLYADDFILMPRSKEGLQVSLDRLASY